MVDPKVVKGQKRYRCCLCGRLIPKGMRHVYERLTPWDHPDNDSYGDWRVHRLCDRAAQRMWSAYWIDDGDGLPHGTEFLECAADVGVEIPWGYPVHEGSERTS